MATMMSVASMGLKPASAIGCASRPAVVRRATVADPCEARNAADMRNPMRMSGSPDEMSRSESTVPIPDSTSTLAKPPPAPVTKMMTATAGKAESRIPAECSLSHDCWCPTVIHATMTAMRRAMGAAPKNFTKVCSAVPSAVTIVPVVPTMMMRMGSKMRPMTNHGEGGLGNTRASSVSAGDSPRTT